MVTAGVYMVARMHVLFSFSGTALDVVALTGAATAVYAATMGLVQNDIKRVLAYSTISQIGYMFIGLGVGAYSAGIFHLMTHAFFKSLLFLAAGSVIHALSGEQDMKKMGGLRVHLPKTYPVFLIGALAISGIPGLSGFFSKDEILAAAFASGHYAVWVLGLAGAAMTAFYMFRLIFLTFHGRERQGPAERPHLHESPRIMTAPLQVLAGLSVVAGFVGLPRVLGGKNWLGGFLESSTGVRESSLSGPTEILLMLLSSGVAVAGIWAAYVVYVRKVGQPAERLAARLRGLYHLVTNRYYVDEFYAKAFVGGTMLLAKITSWVDARIIDGIVDGSAGLVRKLSSGSIVFDEVAVDGAVNGIGRAHRLVSRQLGKLQTGYVYNYALSIVIGLVILIAMVVTIF
jgi:NADH-quinone oxidoreductase subunit L